MKSCGFWRKILQLMSLKQKEWVWNDSLMSSAVRLKQGRALIAVPRPAYLGEIRWVQESKTEVSTCTWGEGESACHYWVTSPPLNSSGTLNSHLALAERPPEQWGQNPLSCSSVSSQVQQSSRSLTCYSVTIILCEDHCISFKVSINHHWNTRKWLLETTPMPTRTIINKKTMCCSEGFPPNPPSQGYGRWIILSVNSSNKESPFLLKSKQIISLGKKTKHQDIIRSI